MLIPSIDLMGGKIVQLVQGENKALEFDDFDYWIERFSKYPLVQVIDLDAARGTGNNRAIVAQIVQRLPCQVGGGIRTAETARELLETGARRAVFGSALLKDGKIMAQTHCGYRVRHDSSTRTILRNLSLYAHRYGRVDGRNPYGCCRCNPASYFPATGGRRWYPDAARDRQPRRAGDGLRCRNGLVCRQDLSLNAEGRAKRSPRRTA